MAVTDSISVFAEGTFEEQIQELVFYLVRNQDEERSVLVRPFQDAFKTENKQKPLAEDTERRQNIFAMVVAEVKGLGDGSDKEIEGFFNLLFSHLLSLYPYDSPKTREYITQLLGTVTSAPAQHTAIKYRILSNLFNALPRTSPLRYLVYNSLLDTALSNDGIEVLQLSKAEVEKWLSEWDISPEEKSTFLKSIVDACAKSGQPTMSYEYSLSYVRSFPATSDAAKAAALDVIATALRLPFTFDFDPLFKLDAVVAVKGHDLFSLLQVFLSGGLSEFKAWQQSHSGVLEKFDLEVTQLERKIRLLTLASLGFQRVGQNVPYSKIAETLQVDVSEVEKWVIDVIRAGLLSGKLSQTTQSLHIMRSTARTFEREQWEVLEKRVLAWKAGLAGVLEVVASARRQNGVHGIPAPA
ncbi:PCI domain-containing protein [Desarmillaria ectypa]|nr:PCI domain-containing protein [Desarmillaria ectypa]